MKKLKMITAIVLCATLLTGTGSYTVQAAATTETTSKKPDYKNFFKKYKVPSKLNAKCYLVDASTGKKGKGTIYFKKSGKSLSIEGSNSEDSTGLYIINNKAYLKYDINSKELSKEFDGSQQTVLSYTDKKSDSKSFINSTIKSTNSDFMPIEAKNVKKVTYKNSKTVDGVVYDILLVKTKDGKSTKTQTVYVNRKTQKISKIIIPYDDKNNSVIEYLTYQKITAPEGAGNAVKTNENDFSASMIAFVLVLGYIAY